uniref:Uncharacterized protein n=1 Tax=Rhizophora mucronata TaxID=61149 RepID=A0A2P2NF54_RHIMU
MNMNRWYENKYVITNSE